MKPSVVFCAFLFVLGFVSIYGAVCNETTTKVYTLEYEAWDINNLISISENLIPVDLTFRRGWDAVLTAPDGSFVPPPSKPIQIKVTVFGETLESTKNFSVRFTSVNNALSSKVAVRILTASALEATEEEETSGGFQLRPSLGWGLLLPALVAHDSKFALPALALSAVLLQGAYGEEFERALCEQRISVTITLPPELYDATELAVSLGSLNLSVSSVTFLNETDPTWDDCLSDDTFGSNFATICSELVPDNGLSYSFSSSLKFSEALTEYKTQQKPHQACALTAFEEKIKNKPYYQTFSCQFRNQPPSAGSYCGSPVQLVQAAASFNPTSSPHQATALNNLQPNLEKELNAWTSFRNQWSGTEICVNWVINTSGANAGRCGANFGNAGCSPTKNYCCSTGGWCGETSDHCTGGKDWRDPWGYKNPTGVNGGSLTGPACDGNHPVTGRKGVCIDKTECTNKGAKTQSGLCPAFGANILCCDNTNFKLTYQSSNSQLCGAYANSQVFKISGNGGTVYDVVKVLREHSTDPSMFNAKPNERDNTMTVQTACAFDKMRAAAASAGVYIKISSAFRTLERQQYFWNCYQCQCCNGGNEAARPGRSNHGLGKALDLNTDCSRQNSNPRPPSDCNRSKVYTWLYNNAHNYGFTRTVQSEPWHWEYRGPGSVSRSSFS